MLNDTGRVSDCHASILLGAFCQSVTQIDRQWHMHSHTETPGHILYVLYVLNVHKGKHVYEGGNIPECVIDICGYPNASC